MVNALADTAKEIRATNKRKLALADFIAERLSIEERAALSLDMVASRELLADAVVELLRAEATKRVAAKRADAVRRSPLVEARYAATLTRGIVDSLSRAMSTGTLWLSVSKSVLHTAYMTGSIPALTLTERHPGSRAGVLVVDFRNRSDFADAKGSITPTSIAARVKGDPKP